jgi:hypothetical protein
VRILGTNRGSQRDYRLEIKKHPEREWPATSTITCHGLRFQDALAEARRREQAAGSCSGDFVSAALR